MAIGRISGPLLKANLLRDGIDLAFETDLLYLDVNNGRIGVNTASPSTDLEVNGTIKTVTLRVDDQLDIADLTFSDNRISSSTNIIDFTVPIGEAIVYHSALEVDDFEIKNNLISTVTANTSLEIQADGVGTIELQSNTNVTGNLYVTGDIDVVGNVTVRGNITLGNEATDVIEINARIQSNLVPSTDNFYDLGSSSFQWRTAYVGNFITTAITLPELDIGNLIFRNNEISSTIGQNIVIDGNGTGGILDYVDITGGDEIYTVGGYRIHAFTKVGNSQLSVSAPKKYDDKVLHLLNNFTVEYLVLAGGGSGGSRHGSGGGGAGGYREGVLALAAGSTTPTSVGAGGLGQPFPGPGGQNGSPSALGPISSTGGGRGGGYFDYAGNPGGSGGGGSGHQGGGGGGAGGVGIQSDRIGGNAPFGGPGLGTGIAGQGHQGGDGLGYYPSCTGGQGGDGISSSITGAAVVRGGGGGGAGWSPASALGGGGFGGSGVGGDGCIPGGGSPGNPAKGSNTGSGGGGGNGNPTAGGSGTAGIVIVRYPV